MTFDPRLNIGSAALMAPVCQRFQDLLEESKGHVPLDASGPFRDGLVLVKAGLLMGSYFGTLMEAPIAQHWLDGADMRRINVEYCANVARMLAMRDHDRRSWMSLAALALEEVAPWERSLSRLLLDCEEEPLCAPGPSHNYRLEANAVVYNTYRNGPIEDLHTEKFPDRIGRKVPKKEVNRVLLEATQSAGSYLGTRDVQPHYAEFYSLYFRYEGWVEDRFSSELHDGVTYLQVERSESETERLLQLAREIGFPMDIPL